jgi:diguanylate cyclase (GGDEF)-like protein
MNIKLGTRLTLLVLGLFVVAQLAILVGLYFAAGLPGFDHVERALLAIAAFSLVTVVGSAFAMWRRLTRRVAELASAARRIETGDYRDEVKLARGDEIGQLANAFNSMQLGIARREQQIAYQAFHDSLTALPNRASLQRQLHDALDRAKRHQESLALMMLDIDRFKEINDTMGHALGDLVLIEIGRRLRAALRPGDRLARFGGDEFVALLPRVDEAGMLAIIERVSQVVAQPMHAGTLELFIDVSIGMAQFPRHGDSAEDLLRRADIAMYDAKQSHSRFKLYEEGRDATHLYRLSLASDLRRAIGYGEFELHYQPVYDLRAQHAHQVEALLRWSHPQRGMIMPADFVPMAEQSGLIRAVTDWALHEAIRQCAVWRSSGLSVGISINLSALDLSLGYLLDMLTAHLQHYGVEPGLLTLEITETAIMRDASYALETLSRLKACGVRLAIDDFGTGYSSLSHLKRMPVDVLKIDKAFISSMATDNDDAVIVRSTIELAHNMGLRVVAEGVENAESFAMLEALRCDAVQGYLISRPLPLEQATAWLSQASPGASIRKLSNRRALA